MKAVEHKKERKCIPPSFINEAFIKTLSKAKQSYWANRIMGNPGQGPKPKKAEVKPTTGATTYFDNDGNMIMKNRAARRQRPTVAPKYTKANHPIKKARNKK